LWAGLVPTEEIVMAEPQPSNPSLAQIVREATDASSRLVIDELRLARAELVATVNNSRAGLIWIAAGVAPIVLGIIALPFTVVFGLALVMPAWVAALITAVVMIGTGVALCVVGLRRIRQQMPLKKTIETLKEDAQWLKRHLS